MSLMRTAEFILHGDLAFFLRQHKAAARRSPKSPDLGSNPTTGVIGLQEPAQVRLTFADHQSLKHLIEALGVPHVEVGEVMQEGQPASLQACPPDGARLEVRPPQPGCPLEEARFLLDNHLGRLAALLRMLGFDCWYRNDFQDDEMAALLEKEPRILLSRDRAMLMRKAVQYGYCPRSFTPKEQLIEVLRRFDLAGRVRPFQCCLRCNTPLAPVDKSMIIERLEPLTRRYFDEFRLCPGCNQVYWKGSHYERMMGLVRQFTTTATWDAAGEDHKHNPP